MTFQKLIVNAVDIIDGMDALSIRKIFVRLAVRFIVMDGIKHFIEVLFRMPPVVEQLIIEPQDLRSPKAGSLGIVLGDVLIKPFPRLGLALLHRIKPGHHISIQGVSDDFRKPAPRIDLDGRNLNEREQHQNHPATAPEQFFQIHKPSPSLNQRGDCLQIKNRSISSTKFTSLTC